MNFIKNIFRRNTVKEDASLYFEKNQIDTNIYILKDYRINFQKSEDVNQISILLGKITKQNVHNLKREGIITIYDSLEDDSIIKNEFFNIFDFLIDQILEDNGKFLKKIQPLKKGIADFRIISKYECFLSVSYIFMGFTNHMLLLFSPEHIKEEPCIIEKVKCIMNYFLQIKEIFEQKRLDYLLKNYLVIYRNVSPDLQLPKKKTVFNHLKEISNESQIKLNPENVDMNLFENIDELGKGRIECLFSSRCLGGSVLNIGFGREELKFLTNPELIAFLSFAEIMKDNETLYLVGSEPFNSISTSPSFKLESTEFKLDSIPSRFFRISEKNVLCIDTVIQSFNSFKYNNLADNVKIANLEKDFIKINAAFNSNPQLNDINQRTIVTGKWGCGANGGDPELKFILQFVISSILKRKIIFSCFYDQALYEKIQNLFKLLKRRDIYVLEILEELESLQKTSLGLNFSLFDYIGMKFDKNRRSNTFFSFGKNMDNI